MSSSSSSSSECTTLELFESKAECEDGVISIYRRPVTISIGDWYFTGTEGCCDSISSSSSSETQPVSCESCNFPPSFAASGDWPNTLQITIAGSSICSGDYTINKVNFGGNAVWFGTKTINIGDIGPGCTILGSDVYIQIQFGCANEQMYVTLTVVFDDGLPQTACITQFNINTGTCCPNINLMGAAIESSNDCNVCCGENLTTINVTGTCL